MVEGDTPGRTVFRLLELIALLLPVVAILVQVSMNTYREQGDDVRPGVRFSTLLLLVGGILALLLGARQLAVHLNGGYEFSPAVDTALNLVARGLALVGASVVLLASPLLVGAGAEFALSLVGLSAAGQRVRAVCGAVGERLSEWSYENHGGRSDDIDDTRQNETEADQK